MSDSSSENRRKQKWIDPQFQRRYTLYLLCLVGFVSLVLVGSFWFESNHVLQTLSASGMGESHPIYRAIENRSDLLLSVVYAMVVFFALLVLVLARHLSHRVVGPIYSIKRSLEALLEGRYDQARVHLRERDEFQDVAELINRLVDRLEERKPR